jgi:hypothetical protein
MFSVDSDLSTALSRAFARICWRVPQARPPAQNRRRKTLPKKEFSVNLPPHFEAGGVLQR